MTYKVNYESTDYVAGYSDGREDALRFNKIQPEQKPVAERFLMKDKGKSYWAYSDYENSNGWQPLYAHPVLQSEQKPVAMMEIKEYAGYKIPKGLPTVILYLLYFFKTRQKPISTRSIPLYTHPAPPCQECEDCKHDLDGYMEANKALINREWVGLSDDDIRVIAAINFCIKLNEVNDADIDFAKDIEQALKESNT